MKQQSICAVIIILALALTSSSAMAGVTISNVSVASEVWIDEPIAISCSCSSSGNMTITGASARITGPVSPPDIQLSPGVTFVGSWMPSKEGNYTALVSCNGLWGNGSSESQSQTLQTTVRRLSLEIKGMSPQIMYTDNEVLSISAALAEVSGSVVKITDPNAVSWKVVISGMEIPLQYAYDNVNSVWMISTNLSAINVAEGNHTLSIEAAYEGKSVTKDLLLQLRKALFFNVTSLSPEKVLDGESMNAKVVATYHDSDVYILSSLTMSIGGIEVKEFTSSSSGDIRLKLPNVGPGNQELAFTLSYNGITEVIKYPFQRTVLFSGNVLDAEGNQVSGGKIILRADGKDTQIDFSNGAYSARIIPETYTLILENTAEIRSAEFSGVELDANTPDFIRLDSLSDRLAVNKIRVASAFAMELYRPFLSAVLKIKYDPGRVMNESKLRVYTCPGWDLASRTCDSGWIETDGLVDTGNNVAIVETLHFSAFMIGEEEQIRLDASLDKAEYYLGDRVTVLGTLRTDSGSGISGVQVTMRLAGQEKTAITNSGGVFSDDLFAPEVPGDYEIEITTDAALSTQLGIVKKFRVVEKRELSLLLPVQAELAEASDNILQLSVMNSGQKPLDSIRIEISGMPAGWATYSPDRIASLEPGESSVISLRISPESADQNKYSVTVKATSGDVIASNSFDVIIKGKASSAKQNENPVPLSGLLTSYSFPAINDLLNVASMIAAFMVLFSMVFFSRKRKPGHARPEVSSFARSIRQDVLSGSNLRTGKPKSRKTASNRKSKR
jgi:hypothetical protein